MINELSKTQKWIIFLLACPISAGMCISLKLFDYGKRKSIFSSVNSFTDLLTDIYYSLSSSRLLMMLLAFFVAILLFAAFRLPANKKASIFSAILSVFLSVTNVLGMSFSSTNSWDMVLSSGKALFKAMWRIGSYSIVFYAVFVIIFYLLDKYLTEELKEENSGFTTKRFLKLVMITFLCWMPYFISFYPGIIATDTLWQTMEYFGYYVHMNEYSPWFGIREYTITNHHPFFSTVLFGCFYKLGIWLGSAYYGVCIYTILQMLFLSSVFVGTSFYLRRIGISDRATKYFLRFYTFFPLIAIWSITVVKDTLFSIFCYILTVFLIEIVRTRGEALKSVRFDIGLSVAAILTMLNKNQGVYIVFIILVAFLIAFRRYWKQLLATLGLMVIVFQGLYVNVLLPALNVAPGGVQEILSIPFQQTARYVCEYGEEVTEEEKEAINAILPYDKLPELYDPKKSDDVKFKYNQQADSDDLKAYFKVWFKQFCKHPGTYFEATLNNIYGFFYADFYSPLMHKSISGVADSHEDIKISWSDNSLLTTGRGVVIHGVRFAQRVPVVGLLFSVGFMSISVIICSVILLYQRKGRYLLAFMPAILSVLVCIASPDNGNYRYSMPIAFMVPLMVIFVLLKSKEKTKTEKRECKNG